MAEVGALLRLEAQCMDINEVSPPPSRNEF
jgi:hypothetical protein